MARVYNFSAGPSMLFEQVLRTAQSELMEYGSSGQSVMEMSHRSSTFDAIIKDTEARLRRVLSIPDNYKVGFIQGGASTQFDMVPLNLMTTGQADYLVAVSEDQIEVNEKFLKKDAVIIRPSEINEEDAKSKMLNIAMLGRLNKYLKFPEELWITLIRESFKGEVAEQNIAAFKRAQE